MTDEHAHGEAETDRLEDAQRLGAIPVEIMREYITLLNKRGVISDEVRDSALNRLQDAS